jgi:hypothetical protein
MDLDLRSKPPVVVHSQLKPTSHKVSKNRLTSSLRCHRVNRQLVWCSIVTPAFYNNKILSN